MTATSENSGRAIAVRAMGTALGLLHGQRGRGMWRWGTAFSHAVICAALCSQLSSAQRKGRPLSAI